MSEEQKKKMIEKIAFLLRQEADQIEEEGENWHEDCFTKYMEVYHFTLADLD